MNDFRRTDDESAVQPASDRIALLPASEMEGDMSGPTTAMLKFDPADYREDLDSCPITDAQKDELLRALWDIMCAFVDLGWGLDAVSLVLQNAPTPDGVEPEQSKSESSALRGSNVL